MTQSIIDIPGLPEGWKAVAYRGPKEGEYYWCDTGVIIAICDIETFFMIVEKIQPRRIVLEEISKEEYYRLFNDELTTNIFDMAGSFWREVKEIAIPLNNDEPKLSLSVNECKEAMRKLETFNVTDLSVKICRFLKDK